MERTGAPPRPLVRWIMSPATFIDKILPPAATLSFYKALRTHDHLTGQCKGGFSWHVYVIWSRPLTCHSLVTYSFLQEKGPVAFDLIDQLLRGGRKVVVVGDLQMDSRRNLKKLSNLFNLEMTQFVLLILATSDT